MAQTRLYKFGNILERIEGLIKSGVIKHVDRPIWFDVLKEYPPKWMDYLEPEPKVEKKNILYTEDVIRARFFRTFGSLGIFDLTDANKLPPSEIFIENYARLASEESELNPDQLFEKARQKLIEMGYPLTQIRSAKSTERLSNPKTRGEKLLYDVGKEDSIENSL